MGDVLKLAFSYVPNDAKIQSPANSSVGFFFLFPTPSTSLTPAWCPMIQLSSDIVYLEKASGPAGQGLSPLRPIPHP